MIIVLYAIISSAWCQSPELPEGFDQLPEMDEILNDTGFLQVYEQMRGQRLTRDTLLPPLSPIEAVTEFSTQNPPQMLLDIAVQQLAQLDNHKSLLLHDLRHAGTCGYRAVRIATNGESQTDFQVGHYVPSKSDFDWAIHGEGFFILHKLGQSSDSHEPTEEETRNMYYTRAGRFDVTEDGKLCLKHDGETYLLQPETVISADFDLNEVSWPLVRFDRPERLQRIDGVLFQEEPGERPVLEEIGLFEPISLSGTTIRSREYETSNVDFEATLQIYRMLHKMQSAILDLVAF